MRSLDRRTLLRGLSVAGGALLAAPLLRKIARAESSVPRRRVVILMEGDSLRTKRFMPAETLAALNSLRQSQGARGETEAQSSHYVNAEPLITTNLGLPRAIEPLEPYRDRMNLVFGLSNTIATGSHSADYGALACAKAPRAVAGAKTIDRHLGDLLGKSSVFSSLALGVVDFGVNSDGTLETREVVYSSSARGKYQPAPIYVNPPSVHKMLFGLVGGPDAAQEFAMRTDLLDALGADARTLRGELRGSARELFEEYVGSLETLRDRQSKIQSLEAAIGRAMPALGDTYFSPHPLARLEAQCDLAAAALNIGLTNVVLLTSGCGNAHFNVRYTSLDPEIPAKHSFGHGSSYLGISANDWLTEVHHRHSACLARLIERLQAAPEAGGSVFDDTLILYLADGGEKHHSLFQEWPCLLISGKNVPIPTAPGGRSVIFPKLGAANHRQLSNLFNTLCHAAGVPEDDFGQEGSLRVAPGPLPELLRV
jgi:hypothetical protein